MALSDPDFGECPARRVINPESRSGIQFLLMTGSGATGAYCLHWRSTIQLHKPGLLRTTVMRDSTAYTADSSLPSIIAVSALGAMFGGSIAALLVVGFTEMLKALLAVVSRQNIWLLILLPLVGIALSVLVLYRLGLSEEQCLQQPRRASK